MCILVQKEIKPIIWGAALTPEIAVKSSTVLFFEDPNVRVVRLLESLTTIIVNYGSTIIGLLTSHSFCGFVAVNDDFKHKSRNLAILGDVIG